MMTEDDVEKSIPLSRRSGSFVAGVIASFAFGVATSSFAVALGVFFTLLSLSFEIGAQFRLHRAFMRGESPKADSKCTGR